MNYKSYSALGARGTVVVGTRPRSVGFCRPQLRPVPNRPQPQRQDFCQSAFIRNLFRRANSSGTGLTQNPADSDAESNKNAGEVVGSVSKDGKTVDFSFIDIVAKAEGVADGSQVFAGLNEDKDGVKDEKKDDKVEEVEKEEEKEEEEEDPFGLAELFKETTSPKKLGRNGEGWFLAQGLAVLLVLFPPISLTGLLAAFGYMSLGCGLFFMVYGVLSCGRSISPLPYPRENGKLVVDGMYAYVRHPMYGGLLMAAAGFAAVTCSEVRFVLTALLWWVLEKKIVVEEKALQEKYPEYVDYKTTVKKLFPFFY